MALAIKALETKIFGMVPVIHHGSDELKKRNYVGDICLSAEYSDEEKVNEYIADDLTFAKELFGEAKDGRD